MKKNILVSNNNLLKMLLVLIIIVVSDDTLLFGTNGDPIFESVKHGILISLSFILGLIIFVKSKFQQFDHIGISCTVLCILVLLTGIVNGDLRGGYFYKCIILFLSCEIVAIMSLKEFAQIFEKIMFVFALASIICTLIAEIDLSVFSTFPSFFNSANNMFYNLWIYMVPVTAPLRNYGIFREPGVYQMFLILALLFHVYYSEKLKISHLIIFILSTILTFSTTAYIALVPFLALFLIKKNASIFETRKKCVMIFLFIIAFFYLIIQTDLLSSDGMIFDKFSNTKRTTTIARFSSVFANIEIWKSSPIFGAGLIKTEEMFPLLSYQLYGKAVKDNTNTLLCELATYGVFYTAFFIYGYIKLSRTISTKVPEQILILSTFFLLSFGEKLTFSSIIFIMLFYGISFKKNVDVVKI